MQSNNTLEFHIQINKYLGTQLNSENNCITVKFSELFSLEVPPEIKNYKIGVKSLSHSKDCEKLFRKQVGIITILIQTLRFGFPLSAYGIKDILIYKINALFLTAINSIFWFNFDERAHHKKIGNENNHRCLLADALQLHLDSLVNLITVNYVNSSLKPPIADGHHSIFTHSGPEEKIKRRKGGHDRHKRTIPPYRVATLFDNFSNNEVSAINSSTLLLDEKVIKKASPTSPNARISKSLPLTSKIVKSEGAFDHIFPSAEVRNEEGLDKNLLLFSKSSPTEDRKSSLKSDGEKNERIHFLKKKKMLEEGEKSVILNPKKNMAERKNHSIVDRSLNSQKVIVELSDEGLEICRYVWYEKYLKMQSLRRIEKSVTFIDLKNKMKKSEAEFTGIISKLFETPMIKLLIEEQVCRMLEKPYQSPNSFAEDVDRQIEKLKLCSYVKCENGSSERNIEILPIKPSGSRLKCKIQSFGTVLNLLINQIVVETDSLLQQMDCPRLDENEFKPLFKKWESIIAEELKNPKDETFVFICAKFFKYLIVNEAGNDSFENGEDDSCGWVKKKIASLLWMINQETYTMPSLAILQAMPPGALATKAGTLEFQCYANGNIEVIAKSCLVPAPKSDLGDFEIIVCNKLRNFIEKIPNLSSDISIEIKNFSHEMPIPNFITKNLQIMGFKQAGENNVHL